MLRLVLDFSDLNPIQSTRANDQSFLDHSSRTVDWYQRYPWIPWKCSWCYCAIHPACRQRLRFQLNRTQARTQRCIAMTRRILLLGRRRVALGRQRVNARARAMLSTRVVASEVREPFLLLGNEYIYYAIIYDSVKDETRPLSSQSTTPKSNSIVKARSTEMRKSS